MLRFVLAFILLAVIGDHFLTQAWQERFWLSLVRVKLPVVSTPKQNDDPQKQPFALKDYHLTPVASYSMTARVLGVEKYWLDSFHDISPVDLALGWGAMGQPAVLSEITITQGGRFYEWRTAEFPIPREEITWNSANTHIIPANDNVAQQVSNLKIGQTVSLKGYLVNVTSQDNRKIWSTSAQRGDSGTGACEIFYVESISVVKY
jgi:hypothetical protein